MNNSNKSLTDRTIRGLLWVSLGSVAHAVLNIIIMVVIARFLTPTEFGIIGAAMIVIGFSQIFSQLGIGPAIVQRHYLSTAHIHVGFTLSLILGCLIGASFYFLTPVFVVFFQMPELRPVIEILSLLFPITSLSVVGQSLLQRNMQFKKLALIDLCTYVLVYGVLGIILAMAGWGVWALVSAQLGQAIVNALIILVIKHDALGFKFNVVAMRQLISFGSGFSLARVANFAAIQSDNLVVGRWMGATELGIYGRAYQLLMMPTYLIGTLADKVLFPVMSAVQEDKIRLARAYNKAVAIIAMITIPLSGVLIVLAPEIVLLLLGTQWGDVVHPFQVFAIVLVFRTSYKISDSLARAAGAVYRRAWRQWVYAGAVFFGAWIGHFWGLIGVASGVNIAILLNFFLMLNLSSCIIKISWCELGYIHLRYFMVALVISLVAWGFKMILIMYDVHELLVLSGSLTVVFIILLCSYFLCRQFYGEEGIWVANITKRYGKVILLHMGIGNT